MAAPSPRTFLALGDSNTIGECVDAAERWPVQLAVLLRAAGINMGDPLIVAKTGWTTDELFAALAAERITGTFDFVSLLVGVNNQYRGRSSVEYREELRGLLAEAVAYAGGGVGRVIVLSIPDWGVMPFAEGRDRAKIAAEIDEFNAVAQDEVLRLGANWVDITRTSRDMRPGWVAHDGLHPSGAQYVAWAALPHTISVTLWSGTRRGLRLHCQPRRLRSHLTRQVQSKNKATFSRHIGLFALVLSAAVPSAAPCCFYEFCRHWYQDFRSLVPDSRKTAAASNIYRRVYSPAPPPPHATTSPLPSPLAPISRASSKLPALVLVLVLVLLLPCALTCPL
jgi:lysophospholipase L1-like esterase